jgi:hypothetical protein
VATERKHPGYRIGRVVLNPAGVKTRNEQIILHKLPAKPVLYATETKERVDLTDRSPHMVEQYRSAECASATTVAVLPPGVHLPSINLVHALPPSHVTDRRTG